MKMLLNIKFLIKQIKWNLGNNSRNLKNEHLVISYETASRDLCFKLKNRLENLGHKVWMDLNDSIDINLDLSIKAIESCTSFLMWEKI